MAIELPSPRIPPLALPCKDRSLSIPRCFLAALIDMDFRVQLEMFRGPLDLLLFLVRKHELDVCDLPIALITEQYLAYLEVLQQLDVNEVGDFLELASTLIEIKVAACPAAGRRGSRNVGRSRAISLSSGCWNTKSTKTRPACSTSGAATGSSTIRGWPATLAPRQSIRPASRSARWSCGTWSARWVASFASRRRVSPADDRL